MKGALNAVFESVVVHSGHVLSWLLCSLQAVACFAASGHLHRSDSLVGDSWFTTSEEIREVVI